MGGPPNVETTITQIPIRGIKKYRWFYESQLSEIFQNYHEGKLKKDEASEVIASVCAGKESYQLFHVMDIWDKGEPIDRRVFRSDATLKKLLNEARRYGWAILNRGLYAVPREVWTEYKKNYTTADRFEVFKLEKLTPIAQYVMADTDRKQGMTFEKLKRLVKYLRKLGIYPEVWESASGEGNYHIYINLVGMVERWTEKKENGEEEEHRRYYLPYASDYRVSLVVEGLKRIFQHLGIPYDSISATRAVWLEGFPNPEKGGRSSRKIWDGKVHRLDKLTEKLRPFWERSLREKAKEEYFSFQLKKTAPVEVGSVEVCEENHSNPIDYLQGNIAPTFRMLDRGYTWSQIESKLRGRWSGDGRAFERAFSGFQKWIENVYRPLPRAKAKPKEKRKHLHYWEHIPAICEVLREDGLDSSINHIHRKTGISKGTLSYIFRIVSKEQILEAPEEAQELLKTYQKGGDRMTEDQKEEARERGKGRWESYLERFLEEATQKRRKSLVEKEKKPLSWQGEGFGTLKGVQIGPVSITPSENKEEDGIKNASTLYPETSTSSPPSNNAEPTAEDHEPVDVFRKVQGIPEDLVKKHLEGKEEKPRYDRRDPLELALVRRAWELVERVETQWTITLGELPQGNYKRLIFGAVRHRNGRKRTYDLGGWGRFAKVLGEVLEDLGYEVIYPKTKEEREDEAFGEWARSQLEDLEDDWEPPEVEDELLDF